MSHPPPYGLMAEFTGAEVLTEAVRAARAAGWARMEAYSPYPVPDAAEAMGVSAARAFCSRARCSGVNPASPRRP